MVVPPSIPEIISFEKIEKLLYLMKHCVCKIYLPDGVIGTGFFCEISNKFNSKPYYVMITCNHVINKGFLKYKESIKIKLQQQEKEINISDNRKIYTCEENDITIIEIIPSIDEIYNFIELNEELFQNNRNLIFIEKSIYIIHAKRRGVSFGNIKKILEEKIIHTCSTEEGSSGAPILDYNGKIIGIHIGTNLKNHISFGRFFINSINEFINNINLIKKYKNYNDKDFTNNKFLSPGGYGDIYCGYSKKDKMEICLKRINIDKMKYYYEKNQISDYQKDLNNEIKILDLLTYNENSVKYFGNYDHKNEKIIVMEKCDEDLKTFMEKRGKALTVERIKYDFKRLNEVFKVFLKEKIIHRDLKLENFLIKYTDKEKNNYIIKIGDYGIGKFEGKSNGIFSGLKGTIDTLSPEIALEKTKKYDSEVDIFSLGIILYQLSHNLKHPFGKNSIEYIAKYLKYYEKDDLKIEFDESIKNDSFKDLIIKMTKLNPINRLKWEDYFEHQFFK